MKVEFDLDEFWVGVFARINPHVEGKPASASQVAERTLKAWLKENIPV